MNCLFCKIVRKEIPSYILTENEKIMAILDVNPISDGHTLLITKKHFSNLTEVEGEDWNQILPLLKKITNKLQNAFQPSGFNFISNMNEIAFQSIFHLHLHIIPKYENNQGFIWTTKPELKHDLDWIAKKLK